MRILMSAYACAPGWSSEPGIGWGVAASVAEHHDVWVLVSEQYRSAFEDPRNSIPPRLHAEFVPVPTPFRRGGTYLAYLAWQVAAYIRGRRLHHEVRFDLVHHVTFANSAMPSLLGRLGIPFVWYAGSFSTTPAAFLADLGARATTAEVARHVVTTTVGRLARRCTIGNRTTVLSVEALPSPTPARSRSMVLGGLHAWELSQLTSLPLPPAEEERPFVVVSIGRLLGWKGFHLSLRAFARVHRSIPHCEYIVIGDGEQRPRLERLARRLGVADAVRFLGPCSREETFAALARSDVLLHPSLHEQVGIAVLEAMAAGRPVVCLGVAGPPVLVGSAGVVVDRGSPTQVADDLAQVLLGLHADVGRRLELGRAARVRAVEHWTWTRLAADLDEVYRTALAPEGDGTASRRC